ncbi:MAG: HAD-IB family phosphatase [Candidatus Dojkabacteria bacterium]|nr:MAG: HAD-IB family phosphatase [Candidatus Dojkabacteria bacterium]
MKLALLDLDGTLLENENPYLELAKHLGIEDHVKSRVVKYLHDELSYSELIRWEVKALKRAYKDIYGLAPIKGDFERLLGTPIVIDGVKEVLDKLREMDYQIFVLSSGLYFIAKEVMRYGIPIGNILCNDFLYDTDGRLSTIRVSVKGDKIHAYDLLISALKVKPDETFYVADNAFETKLIDHILEKGSRVFYAKKEHKIFEMESLPKHPLFSEFTSLADIPKMLAEGPAQA